MYELRTIQDHIDLLNEIKAYRELEGMPFDFGSGLVTDDSPCSENTYYKMDIESLEDAIEYLKDKKSEPKKTERLNRHYRKMYHKKHKHLRKIKNYAGGRYDTKWEYGQHGRINYEYIYYKRYYVGDKAYKKKSNNKIRLTKIGKEDFKLKGRNCYKKFDYQWTIW